MANRSKFAIVLVAGALLAPAQETSEKPLENTENLIFPEGEVSTLNVSVGTFLKSRRLNLEWPR